MQIRLNSRLDHSQAKLQHNIMAGLLQNNLWRHKNIHYTHMNLEIGKYANLNTKSEYFFNKTVYLQRTKESV
jgi:hypothetical protein